MPIATIPTTGRRAGPPAPGTFARTLRCGTAAAGLAAATMLLPQRLAGLRGSAPGDLTTATRSAFVEFWLTGSTRLPASFATLVAHWQRFHLIKLALAALTLAAVVALVRALISGLRGGRARRAHLAGLAVTASLGVLATVIVAATIQGACAPLSSFLSVIADDRDPRLSRVTGELAATLVDYRTPVRPRTPTDVLVADFARYHACFAVVSATLTVVLLVTIGVLICRFATNRFVGEHQSRRRAEFGRGTIRTVAAAAALTATASAVVCAANIGSALDSASALAGVFGG